MRIQLFISTLKADALGLLPTGMFNHFEGEAICYDEQDIIEVAAYGKISKITPCYNLLAFFNQNLHRIALKENNSLPEWLTVNFLMGSIVICGFPTHRDQREIFLKIWGPNKIVLF